MAGISKAFTRQLMAGHSLIGLLFGALIYLICLSGTVIVLVDQLSRWERPAIPAVYDATPERLGAIGHAALARSRAAGLVESVLIRPPSPEFPRLSVMAFGTAGRHAEWAVDGDGRIGGEVERPWVEFVEALHFNLTAPGAIGRYLVGVIGTILLAAIGTGLLAHRRILKDAFRLRRGGSPRLANADLHNRIGIWALPFHLIVALTGSLLGLSGLIIMVLALVAYKGDQAKARASLVGPQPVADARPAPLPDIVPLLARIAARAPGATPTLIFYRAVGTAGQTVEIDVAAPGHLARNEAYTFAGDGRLLAKAGYTDGNVGMRIYGMLAPLHYGTYGGLALKLIYVALGAGLTLIVATGGNIWLARRREQGRATPRLERMWVALCWGQPLILLLTAIAAMAEVPLVPAYWTMTLGGLAASLAVRDADRIRTTLQPAIALAATSLAILHGSHDSLADPMAATIDGALLVFGGGCFARSFFARPSPKRVPATMEE